MRCLFMWKSGSGGHPNKKEKSEETTISTPIPYIDGGNIK